ncbi:MAG TPA: NfeD family protein [Miltoncostaeaceae bacterium]|nr:NfeD family protein [Miltoncostaeaceae bacterium]
MSALLWGAVAAAGLVVEMTTPVFVGLFVAVGAAAAAAATLAGAGTAPQVAVFALVAVGSLAVARRPLMRAARGAAPAVRPGHATALIGRLGHVERDVRAGEPGLVRIGDEVWSALPYAGVPERMPRGARVEVLDVDGLAALVRIVEEDGDAPRLDA